MHLIRNSIDHGIEKPDIRKQKNKSEIGTIKINIDRLENNTVELNILLAALLMYRYQVSRIGSRPVRFKLIEISNLRSLAVLYC